MRRAPRRLEQHPGAFDVGADEVARGHDRPVHVRLGGEVHDDVRLLDERSAHRRVGDVAVHEDVPRAVHHVVEVLAAPGVGELVECGDSPVRVRRQRVAHEVAADEPGAAGDEDVHHRMPTSELSPSMKRNALGFSGTR